MSNHFDTRVLRQSRWILAIVVAAVIALGFVRLGIWQLSRLDERRAENAVVAARLSEPERPIEAVLSHYGSDVEAMEHRRVTAAGEFMVEAEFFSIGRRINDTTGTLVATPFELEDGEVLIVVRGLVPPDVIGPPAMGFEPAAAPMTIAGRLDDGEEPSQLGEPDPVDGMLTSLSRLDLEYIDDWVEGDVLPVMLMLEGWELPNPDQTPDPIPVAELTEGAHFGYAIQWFAFALIVAIGAASLVWRAGVDAGVSGTDRDRSPRP